MSLWVAGITLGAHVLGKGIQGLAATGVDTQSAVDAAGEVAIAEKQQQGVEQKLAMDKVDFKSETLMDAATMKGRESMFDIFKFQDTAIASTGFETADATNVAIGQSKERSYSKYSTDVDNIMKESELSKKGVSLSVLKENAEIEKRLQTNITAATSQADTFLEGVAGQGDYQVR